MARTRMLHNIGRYKLSSRATTGGLVALSAIALASAAAIVHQPAEKAERANPAKGEFVDVDDIRLHYLEQGRGGVRSSSCMAMG